MAAKRSVTAKQQKALDVLLVGGSDQQAAAAAGVSRTTVTGWRNTGLAFIDALKEARKDILRRSTSRMIAATSVAVRAFEDVAKDVRYPSARVSAARSIMEFTQQAVELAELEQRVNELEAEVKGNAEAGR